MPDIVKDYYEAGHGSGHRAKGAGRLYVRKKEFLQRQHLPPAGNHDFEEKRESAWRKVNELMRIPFQRRRLKGEERFPVVDLYMLVSRA